jgi:two-component system sensor histidine kinase RegB
VRGAARILRLLAVPDVLSGDDDRAARVDWLCRLRWVAIAGQLAVLLPALRYGWLRAEHVAPYLGIVGALFSWNLLTMWRVRRSPGSRVPGGALTQLAVDLAGLSGLLLLSGGAWNPLAPIFFIHAALGALLLRGWRRVVLAGLLAAVAALINLFAVQPPALPVAPTPVSVMLPAQVLVALVIWAMTTWVARALGAQRQLVENLRENQVRVDRLRAAGALAAGFSHEFSTPLNTLRMRLDRMERQRLPEEVLRDLKAARDAAAHCESVLRSMVGRQLDPAKLRLESVDLQSLVRRVCASWATGGRHVEVVALRSSAHACRLPTLPFTQALLDLLDNAAEASPERGRGGAAELLVEVDCGDDACRVRVLDRGPGWPEVVRKNLGQPFLTTKPQGTGLGLFNAHSLATALGGELLLGPRDGGGASATIRLPCEDRPAAGEDAP